MSFHRERYVMPSHPKECVNETDGKVCGHVPHHSGGGCIFVGCHCPKYVPEVRHRVEHAPDAFSGTSFDSGFEGNYAKYCAWAKGNGLIKDYRTHVPLELRVNGELVCTYKIDFEIIELDDSTLYVETKGHADPAWKVKFSLAKALMASPTVRFVVQKQRGWGRRMS